MGNKFRSGLLLVLIMTVVTASGCEPLRKKFVRKKKSTGTESQFGVVYDPVDYPDVVKSQTEIYRQHYSLWKIWIGELQVNIEENVSERKIQHALGQMKRQLLLMRELLNTDFQQTADPYLSQIDRLSAEFEKSAGLRNKTAILSQVRALGRQVKDTLSLEKVQDHFVATSSPQNS